MTVTIGAPSAVVSALGGQTKVERVSLSDGGAQGDSISYTSEISPDGRFAAFSSYASNLVSGDTNGAYDIFLRDRQTGRTERVSVGASGQATDGSSYPAVSSDGRYVAFASYATNLVSGDTNGDYDIFVRDRVLGTTERVSISSSGTQADHGSLGTCISSDGRYVAFESFASNLVAKDANVDYDIYVRDRQADITELVSVNSAGIQANGFCWSPSISSDGRYVAFESHATNLVAGDTNNTTDVFVRDRLTGTTERVSVDSTGAQANAWSGQEASISADGRCVAFCSNATNLVSGDTNGKVDIYIRDRLMGSTERVSVDSAGAQADADSEYPYVSPDGRYVSFDSPATSLVPGDTNSNYDVFVRDRQTRTTERISLDRSGAQRFGSSYHPALSSDGRYVVFESFANLVTGDTNGQCDVFVLERGVVWTCAGGSVMLNVKGIGASSYQWRKDGFSIGGATGSTYTTSVPGAYDCIATSACGFSTSNSLNLAISAPLATPSSIAATPPLSAAREAAAF